MGLWRTLISLFLSGGTRQGQATEQLIQKLSETYFIRRPAQLTAYFFLKGKDKFLSSNHLQDINKKAIDFKKEVQDELKKVKDNFKK